RTAPSTTPTRTTRRSWGRSMAIKVQSPGLLTTVQDTGRLGEYAIGMPPSAIAKFLVENEEAVDTGQDLVEME
ncbi:MAG TPA: hypothetical protein VFQ10_11840, partial [Rubrobacter sp.]|nr:hypothetical protein [Rubrobacter sp.]